MRRTRMRRALLVVVAVALVGISFEVTRTVATRQARTTKDLGPGFVADAAQHILNFKRTKTERGRMVWEITADDARVQAEGGAVVVEAPRVTLFMKDGKPPAHITSDLGHVVFDGSELKQVALSGAVKVELEDLTLHADTATYERSSDRITVPGAVTIDGDTLHVTGEGMEVDVAPRVMRVLRAVRTRITNHARS